jgi:hypothetical protein
MGGVDVSPLLCRLTIKKSINHPHEKKRAAKRNGAVVVVLALR